MPSSRCAAHNRACRYPLRSNRGRRQGATKYTPLSPSIQLVRHLSDQAKSKPDTVEKLLSRINQSAVRDEVIAAIVNSSHSSPNLVSPETDPTPPPPPCPRPATGSIGISSGVAVQAGGNESLVSPLHIVARAITANSGSPCDVLGIQRALQAGRQAIMAPVKDRLTKYFGMASTIDNAAHCYLFCFVFSLIRNSFISDPAERLGGLGCSVGRLHLQVGDGYLRPSRISADRRK